MRTPKFRVWSKTAKDFIRGFDNETGVNEIAIFTPCNCLCNTHSQEDLIWQEATDVYDRDGKQVFEGDIIDDPDENLLINTVEFDTDGFGVRIIYDCMWVSLCEFDTKHLKIIGNNLQNPEKVK